MTSKQRYKLVFSGQLLEGFDARTAEENLAAALKLGDTQRRKLFSGRLITVKKGLDLAQAEKFRAVFERAGARVHVHADNGDEVPVPQPAPAAAEAPRVRPAPETVPEPPTVTAEVTEDVTEAGEVPPTGAEPAAAGGEGELECPRCGYRQPTCEQCVHCRMDLRRHLRRLERRAKLRERRRQAGAA